MLLNIMKIWKNLFGKNDKISASEIALAKNLLMSDVSIVERGSNSNGEYVKYADGIMVCWSSKWTKGKIEYSLGSLFRSDSEEWVFPVSFNDNPAVFRSVLSGDEKFIFAANGFTVLSEERKVKTTFAAFSATKANNGMLISLLAIGRWK